MARIDTLNNFLTDIADNLRKHLGTTDVISHSDYDTKIDEVYDAGKQAEYDNFWDFYQQNGLKPDYNSAFRGWKDELYNPKYPIVCRESANWSVSEYMFYQSTITDTKVDITLPKNQTFKQGFYGCFWLVTIRKLKVDESTKFSNSFAYCQSLVNLEIEGVIGQSYFDLSYSKFLSKESIISVINALSTETSGLTVTLSQTAVMNAGYFATPEDWKEWESLIATKPNWTIALIDKE